MSAKKLVAGLLLFSLLSLVGCATVTKTQISVPDVGWRLWPDTKAAWKSDQLFLPDDVDLATLPVNPPSGGWKALEGDTGIAVTLPSTVEQHFWGKFGFRPYTREQYTYATTDSDVQNGNYEGVSWWWRDLEVPASFANKLVLLHIRGARQRAEVYVNQQLVGYNFIAETSFDCDISRAMKPGQSNRIAIRITNPGGRMDWNDTQVMSWGNYTFQKSHGFGGLDRGITISAHDPVYLQDTWVLNTPSVRTVSAHATLRNDTAMAESGTVELDVIDPTTGKPISTQTQNATVAGHSSQDVAAQVACAGVDLWTTETPRLYQMRTRWSGQDSTGGMTTDSDEKRFGFRWFEPRGVGKMAGLYLNDARIRLYTAISWGFWGLNGLWPTPELAAKEVADAKMLGMNCLNFHRNIGKEEVLAMQDEKGLMRYMEAGGGGTTLGPVVRGTTQPAPKTVDTSGANGDAINFAEKYEECKILSMIRQFRSHPSLVIYVIQNETEPDLSKPRVFNLIRKMHALDPSRVIATKSGISPQHQVWMAPFDDTVYHDDGTGYSGWRDEHTVGGPGVWVDDLYQGPEKFTHRIGDQKQIVDWGEMLGSATPDNHPVDVQQIVDRGGESYDLKDHRDVDAAYNQFLDHWGFRSAFPTTQKLFLDIANKCYEFWGKVIETARLAEGNDILTMSGWESTAIENHSGLVDNLRNLKGDPALIRDKLALLLPVVEPRGSVFRVGDQPIVDLYLLNETGKPATGRLKLLLTDPSGIKTDLGTDSSPAFAAGKFVYPIKVGQKLPALETEGLYTLTYSLAGEAPATNSETIRAIEPIPSDLPTAMVGLIGDVEKVAPRLSDMRHLTTQPYSEESKYDLLLVQPRALGHINALASGIKTQNTADEQIYSHYITGKPGSHHFVFTGLPPGKADVSLYFSEPEATHTAQRVFDVQLNGDVVLKDFDILAEAGGQNSAIIKRFTVDLTNGTLDVFSPKATSKSTPLFDAIRIKTGDRTIAVTSGGKPFTDSAGQPWHPYQQPSALTDAQIERVRQGTPLLAIPGDADSSEQLAGQLASAGAFQYFGDVPHARASWMGSWIITRRHALLAGLPSDEVMKGDFQQPTDGAFGLLLDGPSVQVIAAYGRDHDRHIGAALFTARLGKGEIVFYTLSGMQPLMQERLLYNQLHYLLRTASH